MAPERPSAGEPLALSEEAARTSAALVTRLLSNMKPGKEPKWTVRYRIGVELSKQMETVATLEDVGACLGITKQRAYHLAALALGTLACRMYLRERDIAQCQAGTTRTHPAFQPNQRERHHGH